MTLTKKTFITVNIFVVILFLFLTIYSTSGESKLVHITNIEYVDYVFSGKITDAVSKEVLCDGCAIDNNTIYKVLSGEMPVNFYLHDYYYLRYFSIIILILSATSLISIGIIIYIEGDLVFPEWYHR